MKALPGARRSCSVLSSCSRIQQRSRRYQWRRYQSALAEMRSAEPEEDNTPSPPPRRTAPHQLPSPPPHLAISSARLNALHARLSLPERLKIEILARCLVNSTADPNPKFNNHSMSVLGRIILNHYTTEAIMCRYPRLPSLILQAAVNAYIGPQTLANLTREWGVEVAAAPGGEVDPGLLQFARVEAGKASVMGTGVQIKDIYTTSLPPPVSHEARTTNVKYERASRLRTKLQTPGRQEDEESEGESSGSRGHQKPIDDGRALDRGVTLEAAASSFVQAVFGAHFLVNGLTATRAFFDAHILSRHLDYSSLFRFEQATRDLSRLCAREGFISPIARVIAETGRLTRHPVFVVGVFSGREKLGEGSGPSLNEARIRASISALKGWYLYSPLDVRLPSQAVKGEAFEPCMIDGGEIVI